MPIRLIVTGMVIPGIVGIGVMAAIAFPRDGHELTWTRNLVGCAALIAVQLIGGYVAGRLYARRTKEDRIERGGARVEVMADGSGIHVFNSAGLQVARCDFLPDDEARANRTEK